MLILAIYFPCLNRFPWELRKINLLVVVGRHLRGVIKKDHCLGGGSSVKNLSANSSNGCPDVQQKAQFIIALTKVFSFL